MIQDIVGFDAYRSGKADHVSGIRASGDALSFTLTEPAADFLARISLPYFSAVPLDTPALPHGVDRPIPSAGPYYVSAHVGDLAEVVKQNPNYKGPRPHELDAFVVENGVDAGAGARRVIDGKDDYAFAQQAPYPDVLLPTSPFARRYGEGSACRESRESALLQPAVQCGSVVHVQRAVESARRPSRPARDQPRRRPEAPGARSRRRIRTRA